MNDLETRSYQMFVGVCGFGTDHAEDFAANSLGGELFAALADVVSQLDVHTASQGPGFGPARQETSQRAVLCEALRDDLRAISRTAEAIAEDTPGFADNFRRPLGDNDQILLNAARSFVIKATPFLAQFVTHEMPVDFLVDLNSDIANFETAIGRQPSGVGADVAAGAAVDLAIADGLVIVRKLDAIVRNRYRNDRMALAEWTSASHTERGPKRQASTSTPTPPHLP
jgi:hypothetical protein